MEQVYTSAVLFESGKDEERLLITAEATGLGGLRIRQVSDGDLTQWCFEESPHEVDTLVSPQSARTSAAHYGLDSRKLLPQTLHVAFEGCDCAHAIRALMRNLNIPYEVIENPIVR